MVRKIHHITVVGDGGWGTTLGVHLVQKRFSVRLWGPFPQYLEEMRKTHSNPKFLPGIPLPRQLILVDNLKEAIKESDLIVLAIPSQYVRSILKKIKRINAPLRNKYFLSVVKGIEISSCLRISQMIKKELGNIPLAVLSGPTIATEVALGIPSTAVIASHSLIVAKTIQKVFNSPRFRIYTNTDVAGVEFAGSIKNVIAIACGVCDGLGYGTNTKSALVTRGLAEMTRLGVALGARAKTFYGLSGLGDLATTCFSPKSRNRNVGEQLGKGKNIRHILDSMNMVAEGVETVKAVYKLSKKYNISMPITSEVYQIIYHHKTPQQAVSDLMNREIKSE